ncbi:MAG: AraC family transcriptional regulator, partial [bacterium]
GARVKDTAEVVGFHSQHYFSRLFKSRTGMSPLEFTRRQARR